MRRLVRSVRYGCVCEGGGNREHTLRTKTPPSHIALTCFLSAAEHGKLLAAAADVGTSPQRVAYHVARLEKTMGRRLFRRVPDGVVLTEHGRELVPVARRVVEAYREGGMA